MATANLPRCHWQGLCFFASALLLQLSGMSVNAATFDCEQPIGVQDAESPFWLYSSGVVLSAGRLHSRSAWTEVFTEQSVPPSVSIATKVDKFHLLPEGNGVTRKSQSWIQVDLNFARVVTGIQTQGSPDTDAWVTSYTTEYSHDCEIFTYIMDVNGKISHFIGNHDRNNVTTCILGQPVVARCVRIRPITVHTNMTAMRIELLGCNRGVCIESHLKSVDEQPYDRDHNKLPDVDVESASGDAPQNEDELLTVDGNEARQRPYVQIRLNTDKIVFGFVLVKLDSLLDWGDAVSMEYSRNCHTWNFVMLTSSGKSRVPKRPQEFVPYSNDTDRVLHRLGVPVRAHCVRFYLPHHHQFTHNSKFHVRLLGCGTGYAPVPACSRKVRSRHKRVIGGAPSQEGEWPWLAAFNYLSPDNSKYVQSCGGSLIHRQWVLTAAHCVHGYYYIIKGNLSDDVSQYNNTDFTSRLLVRLGDHHLKSDHGAQFGVNVSRVYVRSDYNVPYFVNDIALLRLAEPVPLTEHVRVACLPSANQMIAAGTRCTVTGWGVTDTVSYPQVPYQAEVPVVDRIDCDRMYSHLNISADMMCAALPQGGVDACKGDSGGPLVCEVSGRWLLTGVASWNIGCGRSGYPGVYSNVVHFIPWIESIINMHD